jgi:hypothetical protein
MSEMTTPVVPAGGEGGGELRHLEFSDPPHGMTEERYETMIRGYARETGSRERFVTPVLMWLGDELEQCHGVAPDQAGKAIREFAERVWAEEHP